MTHKPQQIELQVKDVWVRRRKFSWHPLRFWRITLAQAHFFARPGKLLAIIGPNGAGKTTLMRVISGERPVRGDVLLNGQSLYGDGASEYWLPKIGYVPVDSVLHDHLTVRQALTYIAQLRHLDGEATAVQAIAEWLNKLQLADRQHQQLRTLSSGERKKANIAAELLTDPMLLLLDEPTSNLDPNAERELMGILRTLAESGKTVVVVTHTLSTLQLCHEVVFVANGRTYGPRSPSDLLQFLENKTSRQKHGPEFDRWADVFDAYQTKDQIDLKLDHNPTPIQPTVVVSSGQSMPAWPQFVVLLRRQFKLVLNTWWLTFFKLLLGFFGGLFLFVLPAESFIRNRGDNIDVNDARTAFFLIGLVIALIGLISSFQEISREWRIYSHERLKGLSSWSYLISKWLVLNLLVGMIAPIALVWMLVAFQGQPLQPYVQPNPEVGAITVHGVVIAAHMQWFTNLTNALPLDLRTLALQFNFEALISLTLACIAAVTLGLLLSALAKSDSAATLWLAAAVIFHVFMSGLSNNKQLEWLIDRLSIFATSSWAVRGFSVSSALYCWTLPQFKDFYSLGYLSSIWLALICYILAALLLGYLVLRARDSWAPWYMSLQSALSGSAVLRVAIILIICISWSAFLRERSREYYALQDSEAVVRIESLAPNQFNSLQRTNGLLSQAQCPLRIEADNAIPTPSPIAPVAVNAPTSTEESSLITATPELTTLSDATASATTPASSTPQPTMATTTIAPEPTAAPTEPSPAPTTPMAPSGILALPEGKTLAEAALHYGPQHDSFASLPADAHFTLLARDGRSDWLRVLWRKPDDSGSYIGWLRADQTNVDVRETDDVMFPPRCAKPVALLSEHNLAWTYSGDRRSAAALVLDVFRATSGTLFPKTALYVSINGKAVKEISIQETRGLFLLPRYTVSDLEIKPGDVVTVDFATLPADQQAPELFGTLFFVPSNCSFK